MREVRWGLLPCLCAGMQGLFFAELVKTSMVVHLRGKETPIWTLAGEIKVVPDRPPIAIRYKMKWSFCARIGKTWDVKRQTTRNTDYKTQILNQTWNKIRTKWHILFQGTWPSLSIDESFTPVVGIIVLPSFLAQLIVTFFQLWIKEWWQNVSV